MEEYMKDYFFFHNFNCSNFITFLSPVLNCARTEYQRLNVSSQMSADTLFNRVYPFISFLWRHRKKESSKSATNNKK